jgi:hypothetical protein
MLKPQATIYRHQLLVCSATTENNDCLQLSGDTTPTIFNNPHGINNELRPFRSSDSNVQEGQERSGAKIRNTTFQMLTIP